MKLQLVCVWLPSLLIGCTLFLLAPAPAAAGFSLQNVAAANGDTPQAKACGCESLSGQVQQPPVLFGVWYDIILGNRRNAMTVAVIGILIGMFMLRKTNYRQ